MKKLGKEQQRKYAALLDKALLAFEGDPTSGLRKPELPPLYRVYHIGRHYIIYRIDGTNIIVLRVLHDQMDLPRHIK